MGKMKLDITSKNKMPIPIRIATNNTNDTIRVTGVSPSISMGLCKAFSA